MQCYGGVQVGKRNKRLNFGDDPDHQADSLIGNPAIAEQIMRGFLYFQDNSTMI